MINTARGASKRSKLGYLLAWMVLAGWVASGCSSAELEPGDVVAALAAGRPVLYLMPILDRRTIERSRFVLATKQVQSAASSILAERGYQIEIAEVPPGERLRMLVDSRGMELSIEALVSAGPSLAERLLVVYLDLIDMELNSPTLDFRVKVSAVLIDTATRTALWRDTGEASANGTGVFAAVSPSAARYEAIYRSLTDLFASLSVEDPRASVRHIRPNAVMNEKGVLVQ